MVPVAVIAPHADQYSETFIRMHVARLGPEVWFLHGGYFPAWVRKGLEGPDMPLMDRPPRPAWQDILGRVPEAEWKPRRQGEALARWLREARVEAVLAEYGPTGVAVREACAAARVPLFVHFHGYDAYRADILGAQGKEYPALFRHAAGLVVPSAHMQAQLMALGAPLHKLHVVPYGVEIGNPGARPDAQRLVAVGRMVEKKGPLHTLQAFAQVLAALPGARLCMVGDGPLLGECRALAAQLGLVGAVEFTGPLPHPEALERMRQTNVFVQHSRRAADGDCEGLPVAVLEAMACGLPVAATYHAGIPEAVRHGQEGLLCHEGDIAGMAAHIISLLKDVDSQNRLGLSGHVRAQAQYTADQYIRGLQHAMRIAFPA